MTTTRRFPALYPRFSVLSSRFWAFCSLFFVLCSLFAIPALTHTAQARARNAYSMYLPLIRNVASGRIVFAAATGGSSDIYTVNGDGSQLTRLGVTSQITGRPQRPVWSPGGQSLAFTAASTSQTDSTIYVMRADGTGLVRLTVNMPASEPAWSPDGVRIAFVALSAGNRRVYVMRADGSGQTVLTTPAATENDMQPTWSPDGKRIAFVRVASSSSAIYLVDAAGGNEDRLTDSNATSLAWSPDSQQIVCVIDNALYLVRTDGSKTQSRLPGASNTRYSGLAWSPDGQSIFFAASQAGNYDIYAIATDGSTQTRLTTSSADEISPFPSPDGSRIAFISYADNRWTVVIMRSNGTQQLRISNVGVTSWPLDWSGQT